MSARSDIAAEGVQCPTRRQKTKAAFAAGIFAVGIAVGIAIVAAEKLAEPPHEPQPTPGRWY